MVSNAGPYAADDAVVSNTIATSLIGATGDCVAAGGASCLADGSGHMSIMTFPVESVVTYTLHGTLADWGYFENTATVSPPVGIADPNMGDNSATIGRYQVTLMLVFRDYSAP